METASFILSVFGLFLSWYAIHNAQSAKDMASSVVKRFNQSADSARLKTVLERLRSAKEVAIRRQSGAPASASRGVGKRDDLMPLRLAQDSLRTELPLEMDQQARSSATNAADEIATAIQSISDPTSTRDGWKDALAALQVVIPDMEREERRVNNRNVLGSDG